MNEMNNFLVMAAGMNAEQESAFFEKLKTTLTDEEIKALAVGIAYFRIQTRPEMKKQMVNSMAKVMYEKFTA